MEIVKEVGAALAAPSSDSISFLVNVFEKIRTYFKGGGGWVRSAAGILANTKWQVSFLAGYAGTDFIENLYKIKIANRLK